MDNFHLDITGCMENLADAMKLGFANAPGGKAEYYRACYVHKKVRKWVYPERFPEQKEGSKFIELNNNDAITSWDSFVASDEKGEDGIPTLILYWNKETVATKLPVKLPHKAAATLAEEWLKECEYPEDPGIDGSVYKGFRLFTGDFWGHICDSPYSIVGIQPVWAMYGK